MTANCLLTTLFYCVKVALRLLTGREQGTFEDRSFRLNAA